MSELRAERVVQPPKASPLALQGESSPSSVRGSSINSPALWPVPRPPSRVDTSGKRKYPNKES